MWEMLDIFLGYNLKAREKIKCTLWLAVVFVCINNKCFTRIENGKRKKLSLFEQYTEDARASAILVVFVKK